MQFQFSFKHMESSDALISYATDKISDKITKFVTHPIEAHITFAIDGRQHVAQCHVSGGNRFTLQVEHSCGDMYGSIDKMVDKLEVQLKRQKEKMKEHKSKKSIDEVVETIQANSRGKEVDGEPVDAGDIVKFEKAKRHVSGN